MLGLLVAVVIVVYLVYQYYRDLSRLPPGPLPLPIVGNMHQLDPLAPHLTLNEWGRK